LKKRNETSHLCMTQEPNVCNPLCYVGKEIGRAHQYCKRSEVIELRTRFSSINPHQLTYLFWVPDVMLTSNITRSVLALVLAIHVSGHRHYELEHLVIPPGILLSLLPARIDIKGNAKITRTTTMDWNLKMSKGIHRR
jgi:hypothetical protein